jgi:hypothetical protein
MFLRVFCTVIIRCTESFWSPCITVTQHRQLKHFMQYKWMLWHSAGGTCRRNTGLWPSLSCAENMNLSVSKPEKSTVYIPLFPVTCRHEGNSLVASNQHCSWNRRLGNSSCEEPRLQKTVGKQRHLLNQTQGIISSVQDKSTLSWMGRRM